MKKKFFYSSLFFSLLSLHSVNSQQNSSKSSLQIAPNDINLKFQDPLVEKNIKENIYNKINELVFQRNRDNRRTYFWTHENKEQIEQEIQNTFLFKKNDYKGNPYSEETLEEGEKMSYRYAVYQLLGGLSIKEEIDIPSMKHIYSYFHTIDIENPGEEGLEFNSEWQQFIEKNSVNNTKIDEDTLFNQLQKQYTIELQKIQNEYNYLDSKLKDQFTIDRENCEKNIEEIENKISENLRKKSIIDEKLINLEYKENIDLISESKKQLQIYIDFSSSEKQLYEEDATKRKNLLKKVATIKQLNIQEIIKTIKFQKIQQINDICDEEIKNLDHININEDVFSVDIYNKFLEYLRAQNIITPEEESDFYKQYVKDLSETTDKEFSENNKKPFEENQIYEDLRSMKKNDINPFMIAFYKNMEMLYKYNGLSDYSTNIALEVLYHTVFQNIKTGMSPSLNFRDLFNIAMFIQFQMFQFSDDISLTQQEERKIKDEISIRFSFYRKNEFSKNFPLSHGEKEPSYDKNAVIDEDNFLNDFIFNTNFQIGFKPISSEMEILGQDMVKDYVDINDYDEEDNSEDQDSDSSLEEYQPTTKELQRNQYAFMKFDELTQKLSLKPDEFQGFMYCLYDNIARAVNASAAISEPLREIALGVIRENILNKIENAENKANTALSDIFSIVNFAQRTAENLTDTYDTAHHEAGHCFASKKNIEYMTAITLFGDDFNGCTMPGDFLVNEGDVQNSWKEICCNVAGILGGALGYSTIIDTDGASSDFAHALENANIIQSASVEDLNQYPKIKEYMDTGLSMLEAYKNATDKNITLANINDEWKRLVSLESLKNCSANALNLIAAAIVETFKALTETEEKYKTFRTLGEKVFDEGFLNTQEIKRCLSPEFLEQNLIFSKDALMDEYFYDQNSQDKKRAALLRDDRNIFPLKLFEN